MSAATVPVQQATIRQYAKDLKLATVGGQFLSMAEEAVEQKRGASELSGSAARSGSGRSRSAWGSTANHRCPFPQSENPGGLCSSDAPHLPAAQIRNLAEGSYLSRSEPVILLGETGTGETRLATGLAIAACRQRKRVRFTTAAQLVNELNGGQEQE